MKKNTFLEYLKNSKHSNKIYDAIYKFCCRNKSLLLEKCYGSGVNSIGEIGDLDLDYKAVWIDDKPGTLIEFDITIAVNAEVEGYFGRHHDFDAYISSFWVLVTCKGDLLRKLEDFQIFYVDEYSSKSAPKKPLDGDMVPVINRENYDDYAEEILKKYYPKALVNPSKVDVEELAKRMGFTIREAILSKDRSIFGKSFFDTKEATLFDEAGNEYEALIEKGTILVDTQATYMFSYGCRSLTIAHEIVHQYFHQKAFLFAQLFDDDLKCISCQVKGGIQGKDTGPVHWMEIQANAIAPCLLMPRSSFEAYAKKRIELFKAEYKTNLIDVLPLVISDLADYYGCTIYSIKKRLIDIGIEEAAGAMNYVDGKYVRPFAFAKGSLQLDETFTISSKSYSVDLLISSHHLSDVLSGKLTFVENHVVYLDSNYVEKDGKGRLILSEYARMHMDECALKFKVKQVGCDFESNLSSICYLCRDSSKFIEYDLKVTKNPNLLLTEEGREEHNKHLANLKQLMRDISGLDFEEILNYLMEYLDINVNELADLSGLSVRTVGRYINGKNMNRDKKTVVALIRAFDVPGQVSQLILQKAGVQLVPGNSYDDALLTILLSMREVDLEDVNAYFEQKAGERFTVE